ncbi:MAG: cysteine--tRNA ligase, partial [Rubrivivax sp.]|nr:cysteine--tRNA ligase [Rubrivivax sp.]
ALDHAAADAAPLDWTLPQAQAFKAAMDEDFHTPGALAVLFDLAADVNRSGDLAAARLLRGLGAVLGILQQPPRSFLQAGAALDDDAIRAQITARANAKKARDFAAADRIRDELAAKGILLQDLPAGTTWTVAAKA